MEQIKTQNLQGYEEYRNGEITRDQFASTKTQLEKEKLNLQKRIQEVENLIGDEKEILLKKNIPVDQMIEYVSVNLVSLFPVEFWLKRTDLE